jgi:hypothetical protein
MTPSAEIALVAFAVSTVAVSVWIVVRSQTEAAKHRKTRERRFLNEA